MLKHSMFITQRKCHSTTCTLCQILVFELLAFGHPVPAVSVKESPGMLLDGSTETVVSEDKGCRRSRTIPG